MGSDDHFISKTSPKKVPRKGRWRECLASPNGLQAAAVRAAEKPQPRATVGTMYVSARVLAMDPTSVDFAWAIIDLELPPAPSSWRGAAQLDGSGERV